MRETKHQRINCTGLQQAKPKTGTNCTGKISFLYILIHLLSLPPSRCATRMGSPRTMLLYVQMNATTAIDRQQNRSHTLHRPENFSPSLGSTPKQIECNTAIGFIWQASMHLCYDLIRPVSRVTLVRRAPLLLGRARIRPRQSPCTLEAGAPMRRT